MGDITGLLQEWKSGDPAALGRITALIYDDLRRLAAYHLKNERAALTLGPTVLVHEVYLRIQSVRTIDWKTRAQFLSVVAGLMRNVLVDHARKRLALKRASPDVRRPQIDFRSESTVIDVLAVDEALDKLSAQFPRAGRIVELRFFGGLDGPETAKVLNTSLSTVEREWRFARAWLRDEINGSK
jgi:RNA polymerase sigma-70 factor (ECF subfamily)